MAQGERDTTDTARPPRADDLPDRLRRLDTALGRAETERGTQTARETRSATDRRGFAMALRLSSEFAAGVIVGAGLGWGVDWLAGTAPFGLIVFLLLGFTAGVVNIMRSTGLARRPTGDGDGTAG